MESKPQVVTTTTNAKAPGPPVEEECPICMNMMVEPCTMSPTCKHTYCIQCVIVMMEQKHECPIDRIRLAPNF